MRTKRVLALILSCVLLLTLIPYTESYAAEQTPAEDDGAIHITAQAASEGWLPTPTLTVSGNDGFSDTVTLTDGDVLQINGPVDYTAPTGKSPIEVEAGANVSVIINGSVTLRGADASGTTAATAAIRVPEGATLSIFSAHDEELATSADAPKDTLTIYGGNAARGANGGDGEKKEGTRLIGEATMRTTNWYTGAGGNGGGGAAAAIGGNGGKGGNGGAGEQSPQYYVSRIGDGYYDVDDRAGANGKNGTTGNSGETAGNVRILGRLTINATGGSAASGGRGGKGSEGEAFTGSEGSRDVMIGGTGGGGGGGGGCAAPAIGAGGSGGSGGGSGGHPSSDRTNNVQGCGGGGGGGGWPNGGGGGGGGSECSRAESKYDNSSAGGSGGYAGQANETGRNGGDGHSTGTDGHGKDKNTGVYDAAPGEGGYGGGGLNPTDNIKSTGGIGGKDNHDTPAYNGGKGGNGGGAVAGTAWYGGTLDTQPLLLSTACNLNLSGYESHDYGGGQGSEIDGKIIGNFLPQMIYDLMDCAITFNKEYTYSGKQITPAASDITVSYSADSDRDGALVCESIGISRSRYTLTYGENIHCPTGTLTATGTTANPTVAKHASVVGSKTQEFTIKKAKLTKVNISADPTELVYPGDDNMSSERSFLTLGKEYESTAEYDPGNDLGQILRTNGTNGWPNVIWHSKNGGGITGYRNNPDAGQTYFQAGAAGTYEIYIELGYMNDFETYKSEPLTITVKQGIGGTLNMTTAHPRKDTLIVSGLLENTATVTWYRDDAVIATGVEYTPTNADAGKTLTVKITPAEGSSYMPRTLTAEVESHSYDNGFCQICGEFEQPTLNTSDNSYQIDNGGKLFWFAAWVNGDVTHAEDATAAHKDANATLTADISLQDPADTANGQSTEWSPIGVASGDGTGADDTRYIGTFDGQVHTVSDLSITTVSARTGLFAATDVGSTVKDFTLQGNIALSVGNTDHGKNAGVGGAVGCAFGGTVSGVTSKVNISNSDNGEALSHVGGVVGGTNNGGVLITQCVYEAGSTVDVKNSYNCIGGVVGYAAKNTEISYCANRGTVTATKGSASNDPYTGGVLGYLNSAGVTVKNCYNYGTVASDSDNYCGAIIGRLRAHDANKITDNYYLDESAPAGFGTGSDSSEVSVVAKDNSAFTSGEVCYLVNGKVSKAEEGAIWMQDVDNGETPYDKYPVFDAAAVYHLSDGNYSNSPESISVTITWGAMEFEYNAGSWNPNTHTSTGSWSCSSADGNTLTVQNDSNVALYASLEFRRAKEFVEYNLRGSFSGVADGKNRMERGKGLSATLLLQSDDPIKLKGASSIKLGEITVRLETIGGGN